MSLEIQRQLQLQGFNYLITKCIYQTDKVWVYEARTEQGNVVIKDLMFPNTFPYDRAVKEADILKKLDHPNVIKLYHHFWYSNNPHSWQLVFVFEWMPKDLMKEINDRRTNRYMWSEDELIDLFRQIIDALWYLASQGIVHRDIKPQNILISGLTAKITDFGTSKVINLTTLQRKEHSVVGTLFFLSPKLKEGLLGRRQTVQHDALKSDVYSLGLTFLIMAKLEPPTSLSNLRSLQRSTEQEISALVYSDYVKNLLRGILAPKEEERCNLDQLHEYLQYHQALPNVVDSAARKDACSHVSSGSEAVYINMPCHGLLCINCVTVIEDSAEQVRYVCKYCNAYCFQYRSQPNYAEQEVNHEPQNPPQPQVEENKTNWRKNREEPDAETIPEANPRAFIECAECKLVKSRAKLLPINNKLLCSQCLGYYEKYDKYKYASTERRI